MSHPSLSEAVRQAEAAAHLAALTRRYARLRHLVQLCRKHGPEFERLLSALVKILRPIVRSGLPVPIGEILLDARYGIHPRYSGGRTYRDFDGYPGWEGTRHLAHPFFGPAVHELRNFPLRFHVPLIVAAVYSLELDFGPMRMLDADPNNADDALRLLKHELHHTADADDRARCIGAPPLPGTGFWNHKDIWRYFLAERAEHEGISDPDDLSRLERWLFPCLKKTPDWWPPR